MQFVVLLLLVVALALLVLGLVSTSTPLVIASIVVSLVAVYAAVRARGMRDARLARKATEKAQAEKIAADKADTDRALAATRTAPIVATPAAKSAPAAVAPATTVTARTPPAQVAPAKAAPARTEPVTTVLPSVSESTASDDLDNAAFGYVGADLAVESLHLPVAQPTPAPEPPDLPAGPPVVTSGSARHALAEDATSVLPAIPTPQQAEPVTMAPQQAEPVTMAPQQAEPVTMAAESDEPPAAGTEPPLDISADERVWVVDGRPRYHWKSCAFLAFRESEPIMLKQAVEDGFTPCSLCDPDTRLAF